ncbi:putative cation:proton antiporter subunit protein [Rickettsiales endosymbiont of Paramecium tredecaurelia]|nr:putative cation:proton antiporter subunit protein [Candidatus Sarmatiella mevalonica]
MLALFCARFAKYLVLLSSIVIFACSLCLFIQLQEPISYVFGGWGKQIGIEYVITKHKQSLIVLSNIIFMSFILLSQFKPELESKLNIKYALACFLHFGVVGILHTNDLFNLYVFLEVSSLSLYALIALSNAKSLQVCLNYLVFGTISATFILFGIGLVFALTGNLNIDHATYLFHATHSSKLHHAAYVMLLVGAVIKIAPPLFNRWAYNVYLNINPILLFYLSPITLILGYQLLNISSYFIPRAAQLAMTTILQCYFVFCALSACYLARNYTMRKLIIDYSFISLALFLLCGACGVHSEALELLLWTESLNKMGLMLFLIWPLHYKTYNSWARIKRTLFYCALFFSSGMPPTPLFYQKWDIMMFLMKNGLYIPLATFLLSLLFSYICHYRMAVLAVLPRTSLGTLK